MTRRKKRSLNVKPAPTTLSFFSQVSICKTKRQEACESFTRAFNRDGLSLKTEDKDSGPSITFDGLNGAVANFNIAGGYSRGEIRAVIMNNFPRHTFSTFDFDSVIAKQPA
jgi:hypothetical protein